MSSPLKRNTTIMQDLMNVINNLPEAGGVELPELSNPATASELFLNKELIDGEGNVITGTFSLDNELSTQDDLIAQIQAAVDELPETNEGGSGGANINTTNVSVTGAFRRIFATTYTNGIISPVYYNFLSSGEITNAISGSALVISSFIDSVTVSGATLESFIEESTDSGDLIKFYLYKVN